MEKVAIQKILESGTVVVSDMRVVIHRAWRDNAISEKSFSALLELFKGESGDRPVSRKSVAAAKVLHEVGEYWEGVEFGTTRPANSPRPAAGLEDRGIVMEKQEVIELMESSKSRAEWIKNCDTVKEAFNDDYPDFWDSEIIKTGLLGATMARWTYE